MRLCIAFVACLLLLISTAPASGEDAKAAADAAVAKSIDSPQKYALVVVGLAGDDQRRAGFQEMATSLQESLKSAGFEEPRIRTFFGRGNETYVAATQENITAAVDELRGQLRPADSLWLFLLGHGSEALRTAAIHLPGPDLGARQCADLFAGIECREQVFWVTQSASGGFVKPLSRPGRVVIAATAASGEVNETEFPRVLTQVLEEDSADANGDGAISVSELFAAVRAGVAAHYLAGQLLATEHPQLDDNGDGQGSEDPELAASEDVADPLAPKPDGLRASEIVWRHAATTEPATESQDP